MPIKITPPSESVNDHDLLIELNTELKNVKLAIQNISSSLNRLLEDHEKRLREVEKELTDTRAELTGARRTTNLFLTILSIAIAVIGVVAAFAEVGR